MAGAEPVQIHRLRRWPPAPLATLDLPSLFDLEALRLEYPSNTITPDDLDEIESDPAFFMGYFTPETSAGSPFQMAQLELLFANLLAILPVTAAALASIYDDRLVAVHDKILAAQGPISRADLASALSVRDTLVPYVDNWVSCDESLECWQRELLQGILAYEHARVGFMAGAENGEQFPALSSGRHWTTFSTNIDVAKLLSKLADGFNLTPDLCVQGHIALSRSENGATRGFSFDDEFMTRLQRRDPEIVAVMEEAIAV